MLSLPLITPQPDSNPFLHGVQFRPRPDSPPAYLSRSEGRQPQQQQHQRHQQHRRDEERKAYNARSPLALLAADEAAIAQRKAAIRNFGAFWIRPPGIAKTLQATREEEQEALEQEEIQRQEQGMRDMMAQQQLEEARQMAVDTANQDQDQDQGVEEEEEERDLDEDIPEAAEEADVTFNEDSVMEGSRFVENAEEQDQNHYAEMEEAELTGVARDEEELGIEHDNAMQRDLDDSVPEAGSYQHTDTELEDDDSDSELDDSFAPPASSRNAQRVQSTFQSRLQDRITSQNNARSSLARSAGSLDLSSSLVGSPFLESSPVVQRANQATQTRSNIRARSRRS